MLCLNISGVEDRIPVTARAFGDETGDIQFVVMSDRTGGMRAGVFREAVEKVNLLHPQFVISIGDLVDGYTEDPELLRSQWEEVDGILESLDVPFYYVAGNHDISNPWMEEIWKERLGSPYYHFLYKGVLFIVLNTEDEGIYGMTDTQVSDVLEVLEENPDPRWTFIFMHRPLWYYPDQKGFEGIAEALVDRPYTIFSGHEHRYLYSSLNGNKRYLLATTGGVSNMRGEEVGEFDHITHVTLTEKGPKVVHLKLDGFVNEAIVNESNEGMVNALCSGNFFGVSATVAESSAVDRLNTRLILRNNQDHPLTITGMLESQVPGWSFDVSQVNCIVESNSILELPVSFEKTDSSACNLADLPPVEITLTGGYTLESGEVTLPATQHWFIDYNRKLQLFTSDTKVDGLFPDDVGDWI